RLAPGPEAAAPERGALAGAAQAELEGVRMDVHEAWQQGLPAPVLDFGPVRSRTDRDDAAAVDRDRDAGLEPIADPDEIGGQVSQAHLAAPAPHRRSTSAASRPPARSNWSRGIHSSARWATPMSPGPQITASRSSAASGPASVANGAPRLPLWPVSASRSWWMELSSAVSSGSLRPSVSTLASGSTA